MPLSALFQAGEGVVLRKICGWPDISRRVGSILLDCTHLFGPAKQSVFTLLDFEKKEYTIRIKPVSGTRYVHEIFTIIVQVRRRTISGGRIETRDVGERQEASHVGR